MECKDSEISAMKGQIAVLIETLWNVKKKRLIMSLQFKDRFNRNIVECKVRTDNNKRLGSMGF